MCLKLFKFIYIIFTGEQLTFDYSQRTGDEDTESETEENGENAMECMCGSSICRKILFSWKRSTLLTCRNLSIKETYPSWNVIIDHLFSKLKGYIDVITLWIWRFYLQGCRIFIFLVARVGCADYLVHLNEIFFCLC